MTPASFVQEKVCKGCGESKPLTDFYRNRARANGYQSRCKVCSAKQAREWKAKNPDRVHQHWRRWREKQPPGTLPYIRRWHEKQDPEELRRKRREWKRANPEKAREINRQSYKRNLDQSRARARAQQRARRALKRGSLPSELAPVILELVTQPCTYCGNEENIEIDHIVPLSRGGKHEAENLAPACRFCNRSKGARLVSEWQGVG